MDPTPPASDGKAARTTALWQLAGAVFLSSLTALFAKLIKLPVPHIIFWRSAVAAGALWLFLVAMRSPVRLKDGRDYLFFFGSGTLLAVHWLTYFHSIQVSTVAVGIISLYTYPIISILLEPVFDRQRHRFADLLVGAVVFGGVLLMTPSMQWSNTTTQGIGWGTFSAAVYSLRNILIRRHVRRHPAATVMFYQVVTTALVLAPVPVFDFQPCDARTAGQLLLLGVMFTAVHHTLFAAVLKHFPVKTTSVIASVQPVIATTFAWLFLGEMPTWRVIAGGMVVISAAIVETGRSMR
jgi:drug/metabolite transporter (DMT)-like permease